MGARQLRDDPVPRLVGSNDRTLRAFAESRLLGRTVDLREAALTDPEVRKVLRAQREDGSWRVSKMDDDRHSTLVRTFKSFRTLVHRYELERSVPAVSMAAEHLFTYQTAEGDFRGMIGGQYATYYTGEFLCLLFQAGYGRDERVESGMKWLLGMRQDDGGWTIPILTRGLSWAEISHLTRVCTEPLSPDRSKPFSHNWTDMALRAFSVHPGYVRHPDALRASVLLKGSLFMPDFYRSYRETRYWTRFVGWWPNLLTALEVLQRMGYDRNDGDVAKGISWFIANQADDGLWNMEKGKPGKMAEREWLALRICIMLRGFGVR